MKERLKALRKELGLTQQEFADRIGISRNNIASYETNKSEMGTAVFSLICREFNVNEDWLRGGAGEMFLVQSQDEEIASFIGKIQIEEKDSFKKRVILALSRLSESEWQLLESILLKIE